MNGGIPTQCTLCDAPLGAPNITGLCAECKLIARNRRMSATYDDTAQVTLEGAVANIIAILDCRVISERDA